MSHRAVVVTQQSADRAAGVSLYHSQNGADRLRILPSLDELTRRYPREPITRVNDLPDDVKTSVDEQLSYIGSDVANANRVDSEPIAENLDSDSFARKLDFIQYEAVFTVNLQSDSRDSAHLPVEVLMPIFADVGIVLFFSRFIRFEVYPRSQLPDEFSAVRSAITDGEATPDVSLERMEYLDLQERPDEFELLVDTHMGILQTLYGVSDDVDRDELLSMVVTEDDVVVGRVDTSSEVPLPDPAGAGVLVRLPMADLQFPQLVSLYENWSHLAARLRISHSYDAFRGVLDRINQGDTQELDIASYRTSLHEDLATEFGDSVSSHTPAPMLDYF